MDLSLGLGGLTVVGDLLLLGLGFVTAVGLALSLKSVVTMKIRIHVQQRSPGMYEFLSRTKFLRSPRQKRYKGTSEDEKVNLVSHVS